MGWVSLVVMEKGSEWPGHVGEFETLVAMGVGEEKLLERTHRQLELLRQRGQHVRVAVLACNDATDVQSAGRRAEVAHELLSAIAADPFGRLVLTSPHRASLQLRRELLGLATSLGDRLGDTNRVSLRFGRATDWPSYSEQPHFGARSCAAVSVCALVVWASPASSQEESTIRNPGDHPSYAVEIEPHAAVGLSSRFDGVGLGGRVTLPVLPDGFVRSLNDNLAVGVGVDWVHRDGCFGFAGCGGADAFWAPAVAQWNLFFSPHWSAFAEAGLALGHTSFSAVCSTHDQFGNMALVDCNGSDTYVDPAFFVGGRYRLSDQFALTMRIGYPYFSVGGSFL